MRTALFVCLVGELIGAPIAASAQAFSSDDFEYGGLKNESVVSEFKTVQISDSVFNRVLDKGAIGPYMLRSGLDRKLATQIQQVEKCCQLSELQRHKLELAGRGDISRLCGTVEELRLKHVGAVVAEGRWEKIIIDIHRRATIPSMHPFRERSLFEKVLRRQLKANEWEEYQSLERASQELEVRKAFHPFFRGATELTTSQERTLIDLCLQKYPQWRPVSIHLFATEYVSMRVAAEIKNEIEPFLTDAQRRDLQVNTRVARQLEPYLIALDLWPIRAAHSLPED